MHGTNSEYESLDKNANRTTKGIAFGAAAASLLFGSAYFLYSGVYGTATPLHSFFIDESAQEIRIEYYMEDMPVDLEVDTPQWTAFHDELLTNAGYDAQTVRANVNIDVSFIAYDDRDDVIDADKRSSGDYFAQKRPNYGISCYTEYRDSGRTNSQECKPTRKIASPIRTGCSSIGRGGFISGAYLTEGGGCFSDDKTERVTARCCQPTPNTEYADSEFGINLLHRVADAKCAHISCRSDQVLMGCTGSQTEYESYGGAQSISNKECRAQREKEEGKPGTIAVDAICADQPIEGDYNIRCMAMNSDDAQYSADLDVWISSMQCAKGSAMFDCTGFLRGRTEDCGGDASIVNDEILMGEYYRKESGSGPSKVYCEAKADSDKVRVQATCCEYVAKKGE